MKKWIGLFLVFANFIVGGNYADAMKIEIVGDYSADDTYIVTKNRIKVSIHESEKITDEDIRDIILKAYEPKIPSTVIDRDKVLEVIKSNDSKYLDHEGSEMFGR